MIVLIEQIRNQLEIVTTKKKKKEETPPKFIDRLCVQMGGEHFSKWKAIYYVSI